MRSRSVLTGAGTPRKPLYQGYPEIGCESSLGVAQETRSEPRWIPGSRSGSYRSYGGYLRRFKVVQVQLAFVVNYSQLHSIEPAIPSQYVSAEGIICSI